MIDTIPLAVLVRGLLRLNLVLLPVSLLLLLFLGTMAGGDPKSPRSPEMMAMVAAFIFVTPAALLLAHVAGAKLLDTLLRLVPLARAEISWIGILASTMLIVIAGNVFVDDLHQFRKGNYGLSVIALFLDLGGVLAVVAAGGGRIPVLMGNPSAE